MRLPKEIIIIVGNGVAAITAIKAIRQVDNESEIHLFGQEAFYPYNRIRLSKGLLTSIDEDKILLQKKDWYNEKHVAIHTDTKIISIHPKNKTVKLDNGEICTYTQLLLANGAHTLVPPIKGIDSEHVFGLRTLEDARAIQDALEDESRVLNIGGGIQGLETAWILSQDGKKVIIAELLPRLMPKQLDETASEILVNAIRRFDIEVLLDTLIEEIIGHDEIKGFRTKDGREFPCDGVLYAIGIRPNIDILENSGILTNRGVLVDEHMSTNIPEIYAAGDIVELNGRVYGLWNMAIEQGKVAGHNMIGKEVVYEHIVPVTTLNAFELSLFSMGTVQDEEATDILVEEDVDNNSYKKILMRDHKVIGAIMIGNIRSSPLLKRAIEKEIDFRDHDYKQLSIDHFLDLIRSKK